LEEEQQQQQQEGREEERERRDGIVYISPWLDGARAHGLESLFWVRPQTLSETSYEDFPFGGVPHVLHDVLV
jgi:hypothetical protein